MRTRSTCSLDDLRRQNPDLGFAIYAYAPGPLTLEILTPDGRTFPFKADTLDEAIALAFPERAAPEAPPAEPTDAATDIFS